MLEQKKIKILIVDDDEDIRSSLCQRLELEGFDALWAKNGRVALDYLVAMTDENLPRLILLDYMMPVMNGQDFCSEKNKHERLAPIPVVMMTASGNLINIMDRIDEDANGYMAKPLDDRTIFKMIKHFISAEDLKAQAPDCLSI